MHKLPPLKNLGSSVIINNIKASKDGNTYFTHVGAARKTLKFKTNQTYSHIDVLELLSKLDELWQDSSIKSPIYIS